MALVTNNAEGGTNGVTVTTGNSGGASGTAFTSVSSNITFSNAQAAHGSLAYAHVGNAAASNVTILASGDGTTTGFSVRAYVYLTAYPSGETNFILARTSGGVGIAGLNLTATGTLKAVDDGFLGDFTNALSLNTWYRVTFWATVAAGTATFNAAFYVGDSGTAVESHTYSNVANTSTMGQVAYGKLTSAPSLATYYFDDIAQDANLYAEIPAAANQSPTVDAGSNQNVSPSATVNLSASASDPDGTIASYLWTYDYPATGAPTLTGATTATPSFTAGAAGSLYILRCTVTDDDSATAEDTVEVRVPTSGDLTTLPAYPPSGTGSWTNAGGAASEGAALSDSSDTTYVESPEASGTEANRRWRLTPSTTRSSGQIVVRVAQDVAGTVLVKGRLYEGATLREEFTPVTTSTTPTDRTLTLAGGTISAITDWGNLYVEMSVQTT